MQYGIWRSNLDSLPKHCAVWNQRRNLVSEVAQTGTVQQFLNPIIKQTSMPHESPALLIWIPASDILQYGSLCSMEFCLVIYFPGPDTVHRGSLLSNSDFWPRHSGIGITGSLLLIWIPGPADTEQFGSLLSSLDSLPRHSQVCSMKST